jgi:hypothetical protein
MEVGWEVWTGLTGLKTGMIEGGALVNAGSFLTR